MDVNLWFDDTPKVRLNFPKLLLRKQKVHHNLMNHRLYARRFLADTVVTRFEGFLIVSEIHGH